MKSETENADIGGLVISSQLEAVGAADQAGANGYKPKWGAVPSDKIVNEATKPNEFLPLVSENAVTKVAEIQYNQLTLSAESVKAIESFGETTGQVLDFILWKAQETGQYATFSITVAEYMAARGLSHRQKAREQLIAAFQHLSKVRIRYTPPSFGKRKKLTKAEQAYKNLGSFTVLANMPDVDKKQYFPIALNPFYTPVLQSVLPMPYHSVLLRINPRLNPWSYPMGRKIFEHKDMTARWRERGESGEGAEKENILKVESLMTVAGIPTFDTASASERNDYNGKVIKRFERDLNALGEAFSWCYCLEKGKPLPFGFKVNRDTFPTLFILCTFNDYPKETARINAIVARDEERRRNAFKRLAKNQQGGADVPALPAEKEGEIIDAEFTEKPTADRGDAV